VSRFSHRPPVFGWKDENYHERIANHKCMISQDIGYQIFATCKIHSKPSSKSERAFGEAKESLI
jgi:hypothetical protein